MVAGLIPVSHQSWRCHGTLAKWKPGPGFSAPHVNAAPGVPSPSALKERQGLIETGCCGRRGYAKALDTDGTVQDVLQLGQCGDRRDGWHTEGAAARGYGGGGSGESDEGHWFQSPILFTILHVPQIRTDERSTWLFKK